MNQIHIRSKGRIAIVTSLAEALGTRQDRGGRLLFVSPHFELYDSSEYKSLFMEAVQSC